MSRQVTPESIMTGRRERELLAFPSVERMAGLLAARCREPSWVRTSVASLERFRSLTGHRDLEVLMERSRCEPLVAQDALQAFAHALGDYDESQVAALAAGPKIWFRLNGVNVPWRSLGGRTSPLRMPTNTDRELISTLVLLSLIGSGLRRAELLRLNISNVGSLDDTARLVPDIEAEPLAIEHVPLRGSHGQSVVTFLTYGACRVLKIHFARRIASGQVLCAHSPLIAGPDGTRARNSSVARAARLSSSLITTVSDVNLELCMTTGNFFRSWGMPGSRFVGVEEFNMEDFT